jgi:hypothetical protein
MPSASYKLALLKRHSPKCHLGIEKEKHPDMHLHKNAEQNKRYKDKLNVYVRKETNHGQALLTVPLLTGLLDPPMSIFAISLLNAEAP